MSEPAFCWLRRCDTYLVVRDSRYSVAGNGPPLPVRAYPQLGVHLVLRDNLAREDVAHEQVVVHRLRDDLCDRRRVELNEAVVLRLSGLAYVTVQHT